MHAVASKAGKKRTSDPDLLPSSKSTPQTTTTAATTAVLLLFNLCSTLLVINLNKWVFREVDFGFPAALSNVHYVVSWLGVLALRCASPASVPPLPALLQREEPPRRLARNPEFALMCLLIGTVTPLNNTALQHNSAGFYQIAKTAVTPCAVLIEYLRDGTLPTRRRAVCLVAVCACVLAMSRSGRHETSWVGAVAVLVWIPLAAGYKVHFGRLRTQVFERHAATLTLMLHLFPYALAVQSLLVPLVDPPGLFDFQWTPRKAGLILASGVAAFLVNWSGFLVIGHLGGISHVLLGNCKAAGTIVLAALLFGESYSLSELLAAAGALLGVLAYSTSPPPR